MEKPSTGEGVRGGGGDCKQNQQRTYGLSTRVALSRLHEEIERILKEYEHKYKSESCYRKIRSAFVKRYESPLRWFVFITSSLTIIALLAADSYLAAFCLAAILSLDLYIVLRENNLRRTEIFRKTRYALAEIKLAEQELCGEWQPENYPHPWCPMSPCVSLQWTYRDGVIVNLPWALLVKGDHIVLRPGHITPGPCIEVDGKKSFNNNEIYGITQINDPPVKPVARAPLPELVCAMQNTPYLDNLRIILENSLNRPPTIYNQQRYLLVTKYIQHWGFICTFCFTLLAGIINMCGIRSHPYFFDSKDKWKTILLESSAAAIIPLLPLIFPIMWIAMNLWGVARLQCFLKTPQLIVSKNSEKSFEEDLDTPTYDYANIALIRSNVLRNWWKLWNGDSELLPRSANVVQVLGSITALCCIDKKGILSWPNPTAEKVFFLHDIDIEHPSDEATNSQSTINTVSEEPVNENNKEGGVVAEVLDLTHDQHCPFRLEFDDHEWKTHIKSLKPLGLAILLNTCSPLTHAHYAQFCGHVTAVAMLDKDLVPVTNRYAIVESSLNSFLHGRCLCELAKQIGFTDHATDHFSLEGQLASYRHLQPDVVRRDIRFARQLQLSSKVKVPFPHSLSVCCRETPGGYLSLFTQGTADIILDFCDDFWDGKDLRPLSTQDRKRALDFYQRSALTAYCTAFAYRPLRHGIQGALSGIARNDDDPIAYLELPPESKIRMQHVDQMHCDFKTSAHGKLSHSISTDSLLFSENKDDEINDVENCFEMQCHQVFIGMVTMQYQAQTDIVQLVEHLDRACIRFVHFSKENELRSRVFSEKMGLESGWNCHISLLSETDEKVGTDRVGSAAGQQSPRHSALNQTVTNANNVTTIPPSSINTNTTNLDNHQQTNPNSHTIEPTTSSSVIPIMHTKHTATINVQANQNLLPICNLGGDILNNETDVNEASDLNNLLPPAVNLESSKTLSSSAPGAISNPGDCNTLHAALANESSIPLDNQNEYHGSQHSLTSIGSQDSLNLTGDSEHLKKSTAGLHRHSNDSAMEENCRSISILTESTEQSAPVHFDMSNRAKLPRGIENIRPHLEKVDNVPLQVSLFTDCSAEATCEMLEIMQFYGEIVVCMGSSASNANAKIFLQGDCSIAVEPLYPQVCQDISAYTELNILNNKLRLLRLKRDFKQENHDAIIQDIEFNQPQFTTVNDELLTNGECGVKPMQSYGNTISPIYLSRLLNSLPCSISICRDEPLSLVAIIELSRRFSAGLWNCIQFWACCAGTLAIINMLTACLYLPPLLTPMMVIYLMCIPVPLISVALAHIDGDPKIMNRATGKKQTKYDTRVFAFVVWCYGFKFITPILIMILSYCAFTGYPVDIMDVDEENFHLNLTIARIFSFLGILVHFVIVSVSFVHRDHSIWQKNPLRNRIWIFSCFCILFVHTGIMLIQLMKDTHIYEMFDESWPIIIFLFCGSLISMIVTEITKWQEIKVNSRYQRRARLDFGTKLGMNSPF